MMDPPLVHGRKSKLGREAGGEVSGRWFYEIHLGDVAESRTYLRHQTLVGRCTK
jgi:hypothetical protein